MVNRRARPPSHRWRQWWRGGSTPSSHICLLDTTRTTRVPGRKRDVWVPSQVQLHIAPYRLSHNPGSCDILTTLVMTDRQEKRSHSSSPTFLFLQPRFHQ